MTQILTVPLSGLDRDIDRQGKHSHRREGNCWDSLIPASHVWKIIQEVLGGSEFVGHGRYLPLDTLCSEMLWVPQWGQSLWNLTGTSAAEEPAKFQSDRTITNTNIAVSRLLEILRQDFYLILRRGPVLHRCFLLQFGSAVGSTPGLILDLCLANERWRYFVKTSLIGWVQA